MTRRKITLALAIATFCIAAIGAGSASAHITIQPNEVPAESFKRLDVRVPNESESNGTTKVQVEFPPGFVEAATQPIPGWTVKTTRTKLSKPVEMEGESIATQVGTVTWTADSPADAIGPGEFQDFGISAAIPDTPGKTLTFKAIQTYEGGDVARWIGAPNSEEPAPTVAVTASEGNHHASATAKSGESEHDSDHSETLATVALIVAGVALLLAVAALVAGRRKTA